MVASQGSSETIFADVGWLALANGSGTIDALQLQSGWVMVTNLMDETGLSVDITFQQGFASPPLMFASYVSIGTSPGGHLRLVSSDESSTVLALEYDSCDVMAKDDEHLVGWVALSSSNAGASGRVHPLPTAPSDTAALLDFSSAVRLPAYYRWRNGSDPCRERWAGCECAIRDEVPRVVVLDVSLQLHSSPSASWARSYESAETVGCGFS